MRSVYTVGGHCVTPFYAVENNGSTTAATLGAPSGGGLSFGLVEKVGDTQMFGWDVTATDYRLASACYSAEVGSSPSAHTVVFDAYAGTITGFYAGATVDVTGHDATSPIVQSVSAGAGLAQGNAISGMVTLNDFPTEGNLVVAAFSSGADAGGGFATPNGFTALFNQNASYCQLAVFYRVTQFGDGQDIECADLGQTVGNWTAHAVEVAIAPSGPPPSAVGFLQQENLGLLRLEGGTNALRLA